MSALRKTGIPSLGDVRWGSHICMFYPRFEDTFSVLVPYFTTGLENNEHCFWVAPDRKAVKLCGDALRRSFPDLDERMASGQIEIVPPEDWYLRDGEFDADRVLSGWTTKLNKALQSGFDGMRIAGDTSWLDPDKHALFMDYERRVGDLFEDAKGIAICCYRLDLCSSADVIDVVSVHHLTMVKEGQSWKLVENAERKRALETVNVLEEQRKKTEENLPIVLYSALPDEQSTTVMLTEKMKDLSGYSADEFMRRPELFGEIIHPDDRDKVWSSIVEHREKKIPLKLEYRLTTKSGQVKWIKDEAVPVLDENGNLVRIDGFMDDITDLKEVEEALRLTEERYKLAQRAAKIGSWDWDIVTGKLVWSEEIEPMFGFQKGGFEGTYEAFLKCVHPDDRKFLEESVAACVNKGDKYDIDHRIVWPDSSVHWLSETGDVIRDSTGKAVRMLGVVRDITIKKTYEESIRRLNRQLEESNKELEAFCYSVSHDLRAPLRRIDGFSQIILEEAEGTLDDKTLSHLNRIRASTKTMDQLIDDLLRLSRITTSGVSRERVDLSDLARAAANKLVRFNPTREVQFKINGTPPVYGDKHLLEIAVQNLMDNAWKFTAKREKTMIEFGSKTENGQSIYYIKDNGIGFDMKGATKLFEPFQRLQSSEGFPGTGIGLAIVHRVVSRHNGRIWAESELGIGTTFYFSLKNGTGHDMQ